MTSPILDCKHGRQRRAWHNITTLGQHTQSAMSDVAFHHRPWTAHTVGNVGRGMPSYPLDGKHRLTTSGVVCHYLLWAAKTVEQCRAWHAIIALGRQTRSNNVRHDMPSPPLDSTHGRTTSGVTCHHRLWKAHTFKQRQAWIEITALRLHARLEDVGRGMTSPPLDSTDCRQRRAWHDITAFVQHTRSDYVGRGMTSPPLDSTHSQTTSAWHDITALGQHTRSNDVGRDVPSPHLDYTHGRTTLGMECHHRLWTPHTVEQRRA